MKKNHLHSLLFFLCIVFIIAYITMAAKPLTKEYHFKPEWKVSTANPSITQNTENKEVINFRLGNSLGYFTDDGEISLYKTFSEKASISDYYYSIYNTTAKSSDVYNCNNEKCFTIQTEGFPYFIEKEIYLMLPGGASFSKYNSDGKLLWSYKGVIPVTAFNANDTYTVAGFLNGEIKVFNNEDGTLKNTYSPGGSDSPVILGIDISDNGKYIASVSGHNKQRFVVTSIEETYPKIIYHKFLNEDGITRTLVHFCSDQKRVFFINNKTINIYDLNKNKCFEIKSNGKIVQIDEAKDLVYLLEKNESQYTVYIVEKSNTLEGRFSFTANSAFIKTKNKSLYIGKDNTISKVLVTKE